MFSKRSLLVLVLCVNLARAGFMDSLWGGDAKVPEVDNSCPADDVACESDYNGYLAIGKLAVAIDANDDGVVEYTEAVTFVEVTVVEELKEGYRTMESVVSYGQEVGTKQFWSVWSSSLEYNWNSEELAAWAYKELDNSVLTEVIITNNLNGKDIARFTEEDGKYAKKVLELTSDEDLELIKTKSIALILFGQKTYLYAGYTLISFLITTGILYSGLLVIKRDDVTTPAKEEEAKVEAKEQEKNVPTELDIKKEGEKLEEALKPLIADVKEGGDNI